MYHSVTSRMPLGSFRNGAGTSAMSPSAVPPKFAITARPVARAASTSAAIVARSSSVSGLNSSRLSSTFRWSSSKCFCRMIESKKWKPFGIRPLGSADRSPCGIDQRVAVRVDRHVELPGHEHFQPVEGPGLPVLVLEAEHRLPPEHALDVDAQRLLQVLVQQPQHLVRLVDLHRPLLQPVMVAQRGHATDVNARHRRAAEVDRHPVRLFVVQRVRTRCRHDTVREQPEGRSSM